MAGSLDEVAGGSGTEAAGAAGLRARRATTAFALFLSIFFATCVTISLVAMRSGTSAAIISGDGIGYYAWLRSAVLDRDLDFRNDYALLYPPNPLPSEMQRRTARGLVPNKYTIGMAIVELPGFLAGHAVALLIGSRADGQSGPYQLGIALWMQLLFVSGGWMLWRALTRMTSDALASAFVVASILTATNVVHYAAKDPSMPHSAGFALLSATIFLGARAREFEERRALWYAIGALLGLVVIVRPSSVAFAPFFVVFLNSAMRRKANVLRLSLAFLVVVCLQVAVASWFWSAPTFTRYEGEGFTAGLAGVGNTLLASRHGLFVYHPWYLVMLVICVMALRERLLVATAAGAVASFMALVLINGTWWSWWFGDGFGNRAFIEALPILGVPVALWLSLRAPALRRRAGPAFVALALVCSLLNALLWTGFLLRRYPADGNHSIGRAYLWMTSAH